MIEFQNFTKVKSIPQGRLSSQIPNCVGQLKILSLSPFTPEAEKQGNPFYEERKVDGKIEEANIVFSVGVHVCSFFFYSNFKAEMIRSGVTPKDVLSGKCLANFTKGILTIKGVQAEEQETTETTTTAAASF